MLHLHVVLQHTAAFVPSQVIETHIKYSELGN
jgi:hypothetical protein